MDAYLDHPARPVAARDVDRSGRRHQLARLVASLAIALALVAAGALPTMAARPTQAQRVVRAVTSYIGARYVTGATGPSTFDCSGLVYRAFREAGLAKRIGGELTASGYYHRFRRLGRFSRVAPRVGDLVVYDNGGHIGIYVGRGTVVSALLSGVKRHAVRGLNIPFTGFLRVDLNRQPRVRQVRRTPLRIVIADRRLPVRANPGPDSHAIGVIRRGARVAVRGSRTRWGVTWLRVRSSNGRYGWVRESLTHAR